MLKISLFLSAALASTTTLAHEMLKAESIYYIGQQKLGLIDQKECYVEAQYSTTGSKVNVRTLVNDPHGDGDLIGLGEVLGKYSSNKVGYYFFTNKKNAPIQQMLLNSVQKKQGTKLSLVVAHQDHYDALTCETLVIASEEKIESIKQMFVHFEDYIENGNHSHGHNHKH